MPAAHVPQTPCWVDRDRGAVSNHRGPSLVLRLPLSSLNKPDRQCTPTRIPGPTHVTHRQRGHMRATRSRAQIQGEYGVKPAGTAAANHGP